MRKIGTWLAIVALIGLDQWVKWWTVENIALHEVKPFLTGIVSLSYLRNYGAAFSILQDQQWFFVLITIVVLSVASWYLFKHINGSLWLVISLILIIAGGLGNFIDRVRLGYVVDMFHLDFIDFPVFNIADLCLTIGVGALFVWMMKEEKNGTKD